ncbi:MAG: sugar ABC transporter permease [Rhodospirillales bacterium]|nr:sugar ABC transporter permease [Rhodospirillales bacterium]
MDGSSAQVVGIGSPIATHPVAHRKWRAGLQGPELIWALAFLVPYIVTFLLFVVYPIVYGLWMGSDPALYADLFSDPIYQQTVVNTLIFVLVAVNLRMVMALALSGFFMRKRWWIKGLMIVFILPWAVPALPTFLSIHWMLNGDWGLVNNLLWSATGINGPSWLDSRWLALGADTVAYLWKWLPFWTVILLAGRMAIPQELFEAADVDGASRWLRFKHVTFPLIANLYLVLTLLGLLFTLGDFTTVYFVSGGGPANSTHVLATLGIRDAFVMSQPRLGVAAVMSAIPVLIPLVIWLMHQVRASAVEQ